MSNHEPGSTATVNYGDGAADEPMTLGEDGSLALSRMYSDNGVYIVVVSVTDPHGTTVSDELLVTVLNVNPTIDSLTSDTEIVSGQQASFAASASDVAGADDPLTYTWDFGDGGDPLSGVDLTNVNHVYDVSGDLVVTLTVTDGDGGSATDNLEISVAQDAATVVGRHVFYNNCAWDGNESSPNAEDDAAIDVSKQALLPGETATLDNYTGYSRGLNGVMVDIDGLAGTPGIEDFLFRAGNSSDVLSWTSAPTPQAISVRPGAGGGGSDRVTLIWAGNAIENEWLQVVVRSTSDTGLAEDDVFYFGNAPCDANSDGVVDFDVDLSDFVILKANFSIPGGGIDAGDFDMSGITDLDDFVSLKKAFGSGLVSLEAPQHLPSPGDADDDGDVDMDDFVVLKQNFLTADVAWRSGDFNADGITDMDDFVILKQNFLTGIPAATPAVGIDNPIDLLAEDATRMQRGPAELAQVALPAAISIAQTPSIRPASRLNRHRRVRPHRLRTQAPQSVSAWTGERFDALAVSRLNVPLG